MQQNSTPIKLGIFGSGKIAQEIVPHLHQYGFQPVAVAGRPSSQEKLARFAAANAIPRIYLSQEELLADQEIACVYIALPNQLHYRAALAALLAGKDVILEKPLTSTIAQAEKLYATAAASQRFLLEAVTTIHLPLYHLVQEKLPEIGDIKIVSCNYSQYSSRYDQFLAGTVLPAFDPACAGGALMDLGVYNINFLVGLFGEPEQVFYQANFDRGIDTSGVLTLKYPSFQAVAIAAKDCAAPVTNTIQGTRGAIICPTPVNEMGQVSIQLNGQAQAETHEREDENRFAAELKEFARVLATRDEAAAQRYQAHSLAVTRVVEQARRTAGLKFPADQEL